MRRFVLAVSAVAFALAAVPAHAWPPVCKEPVYTLLHKCI
jgi:hypothetical protein